MVKYILTDETLTRDGATLYRIKAIKNFADVEAGDLGGFVQSENNLSHEGDAWVFSNAKVQGNARVYGNAQLFDNAWVRGNAKVFGNAWVFGDAKIYGDAKVCGASQC